jgi:hypothetical protein
MRVELVIVSSILALLVAVVVVHILARVASLAYFRSKAEYERRKLIRKLLHGETDAER